MNAQYLNIVVEPLTATYSTGFASQERQCEFRVALSDIGSSPRCGRNADYVVARTSSFSGARLESVACLSCAAPWQEARIPYDECDDIACGACYETMGI